jgi:hypothetical protein
LRGAFASYYSVQWQTQVSGARNFSRALAQMAVLSGFFKGTSAEQDRRFSDKELKLLKSVKFPPEFDKKVGTVASSVMLLSEYV